MHRIASPSSHPENCLAQGVLRLRNPGLVALVLANIEENIQFFIIIIMFIYKLILTNTNKEMKGLVQFGIVNSFCI